MQDATDHFGQIILKIAVEWCAVTETRSNPKLPITQNRYGALCYAC
jgi:hypothetical protein